MDALLTLQRVTFALDKTFEGLIDMSDVRSTDPAELRTHWLSRALASYCITAMTDADPKDAANSVTDCYGDQGLDAIYFSNVEDTLYLVQSKWYTSGRGSINFRDCTRFLNGVQALIRDDYSGFDDKIKKREQELRGVLMRPDVRIVLIIGYTGADPLAPDIERAVSEYVDGQNNVGDTEVFTLERFNLERIYSNLGKSGQNIDLRIILTEWATIDSPFRAYYGQVRLADIASWADHGKMLFTRNLRYYRGATDVNEAIEESIYQAPDQFWYLNNGVTVLCSTITKAPLNGNLRNFGVFECTGVSVVNGAQTIGVVWEAAKRHQGSLQQSTAKIHVRLISLENCPDGFDRTLTKATNNQNRIDQRDFAALDELQHRLAREMALDGRRYAFKTGDPDPKNGEGCSIEEAAVALACADSDVTLSVYAKREISSLWRDITRPPYTKLFNEKTTATTVWRAVVILRAVAMELDATDKSNPVRGNLVAVHGNRFILHHIFQDPEIGRFRDGRLPETGLIARARELTPAIFAKTCEAVQSKHANAYPANLFKNLQLCRDLLDKNVFPPEKIGPLFEWMN